VYIFNIHTADYRIISLFNRILILLLIYFTPNLLLNNTAFYRIKVIGGSRGVVYGRDNSFVSGPGFNPQY
jgi:hypothetical protein